MQVASNVRAAQQGFCGAWWWGECSGTRSSPRWRTCAWLHHSLRRRHGHLRCVHSHLATRPGGAWPPPSEAGAGRNPTHAGNSRSPVFFLAPQRAKHVEVLLRRVRWGEGGAGRRCEEEGWGGMGGEAQYCS
eukprot:gene10192-biopygen18272